MMVSFKNHYQILKSDFFSRHILTSDIILISDSIKPYK